MIKMNVVGTGKRRNAPQRLPVVVKSYGNPTAKEDHGRQKRGYTLMLSSFLYFFAVALDRALLIPRRKYAGPPERTEKRTELDAKRLASYNQRLTDTRAGNNDTIDAATCRSLLHEDYRNANTVVETKGAPHPRNVVYAPPARQSIITRHVEEHGVWEYGLYQKIRSRIKPGMVFLDVGANIGLFSVYAQSLGAKVIAVEAMESNSDFVSASECYNSFLGEAAVAARNAASASRGKMPRRRLPGEINLYNYAVHPSPDGADCTIEGLAGNRDDGHLLCEENDGDASATKSEGTARLARLDSIVLDALGGARGGDDDVRVDLMKIDVEGFEQAAMESASRLRDPPRGIAFECDARQARAKGHTALFWRRYSNENERCNGYVYTLRDTIPLMLPHVPFADAIALGTCGGANFFLDCSGWGGEGVLVTFYRWSVHLFFLLCFVVGLALATERRHEKENDDDESSIGKRGWNPYLLMSIAKEKWFVCVSCLVVSLAVCCRILLL